MNQKKEQDNIQLFLTNYWITGKISDGINVIKKHIIKKILLKKLINVGRSKLNLKKLVLINFDTNHMRSIIIIIFDCYI